MEESYPWGAEVAPGQLREISRPAFAVLWCVVEELDALAQRCSSAAVRDDVGLRGGSAARHHRRCARAHQPPPAGSRRAADAVPQPQRSRRAVLAYVSQRYGLPVLRPAAPRTPEFVEAPLSGQSVLTTAPRSPRTGSARLAAVRHGRYAVLSISLAPHLTPLPRPSTVSRIGGCTAHSTRRGSDGMNSDVLGRHDRALFRCSTR